MNQSASSGEDWDDFDEEGQLARYEERRQRALTQPPGCLQEFAVERAAPDDLAEVSFDGHGTEDNAVYRVRCRCGGEGFRVIGHATTNDVGGRTIAIFVGPLELACDACGRPRELFDSEKHGYDAEIGGMITGIRGRGPRVPYACLKCGTNVMKVWTRFGVTGEPLNDSFADALSGGREQDFFSWFTVVGRCAACGEVQIVADFECA